MWDALRDEDLQQSGPRYAEKIVQHEVELPVPPRSALLSILDTELKEFFASFEGNERFHIIVYYGLHNWIRSPRSSIRLANAIKYSWTALREEIDPVDMLAMEAIRIFDYDLFQWIRENREILVDRQLMLGDDQRKKRFDAIVARLEGANKDYLLDVLGALFPARAEAFGKSRFGSDPHYAILNRGGVGTTQGYDTYFSLYASIENVSKSSIDTLVQNLDDRQYIVDTIRSAQGKLDSTGEPLIATVLSHLSFRFLPGRIAPTEELLSALIETGPSLIAVKWTGAWFKPQPAIVVGSILREMVKHWGPGKAAEAFLAYGLRGGSELMIAFIMSCTAHQFSPTELERDGYLSDEQSAPILTETLSRFREAAAEGRLGDASTYWPILQVWQIGAVEGEIRSWVATVLTEDAARLVRLPLWSASSGGSGIEYSIRERPDPNLYDLDLLQRAADTVLLGNPDEEARQKANAILSIAGSLTTARPDEENDGQGGEQ